MRQQSSLAASGAPRPAGLLGEALECDQVRHPLRDGAPQVGAQESAIDVTLVDFDHGIGLESPRVVTVIGPLCAHTASLTRRARSDSMWPGAQVRE